MQAWQQDQWLSQILQRPVMRGQWQALNRPPQFSAGSFLYLKLPVAESQLVRQLQEWGFYLADTAVTLEAPFDTLHISVLGTPDQVRWAQAEDESAVRKIAASSFVYSRFHQDPFFGKALANQLKAEWASNFFLGLRGSEMAVACIDGQIAAFCQLLRQPPFWVIDLIAVSPAYQQRGLGKQLLSFLTQAAQTEPALKQLRVGTQLANQASLRLYQQAGMKLCAAEYIFHKIEEAA